MLNIQKPYGIVAGKPGVKYEQNGKFFGPDGQEIGFNLHQESEKKPNAYLDKEEIIATLEKLEIPHDKRWSRDKLLNLIEENVAAE